MEQNTPKVGEIYPGLSESSLKNRQFAFEQSTRTRYPDDQIDEDETDEYSDDNASVIQTSEPSG